MRSRQDSLVQISSSDGVSKHLSRNSGARANNRNPTPIAIPDTAQLVFCSISISLTLTCLLSLLVRSTIPNQFARSVASFLAASSLSTRTLFGNGTPIHPDAPPVPPIMKCTT